MIILKGVTAGPFRGGPGVGHKIVSDTKQMTKEKKKEWEKGKMCKEKENGRMRERKIDGNKRGGMQKCS